MNRKERRAAKYGFNDICNIQPSMVYGQENLAVVYYREYLLDKIRGFLVWDNIPEYWDMEYFMRKLLFNGSIGVVNTKYGVLPLAGHAYGVNVFQKPNMYEIAVPNVQARFAIGYGGVVLNLKGNYKSFYPLFDRYAYLLANCDAGVAVNLLTTRTPYIARAATKVGAASFKDMIHKITRGDPAVAIGEENDFTWDMINIKNSFVAPEVQDMKRRIIQEFEGEFGINVVREDKKERMITSEANGNQGELKTNVAAWMTNIKDQIKETNKMFGFNIGVKHITESEQEENYESNDTLQSNDMGRKSVRDSGNSN